MIATPARLRQLIQAEVVHMQETQYVVLDASFRDEKQRTLLDLEDTRGAVFEFLQDYLKTSRHRHILLF